MHVLKDFKIVFPSGYGDPAMFNDNIDINIVLKNGEVYFATAFTLANIKHLMDTNNSSSFWAPDLFIVKDLSKSCLLEAIGEMINDGSFLNAFTRIATIESHYPGKTFDDLPDMADGFAI